MEIHILQKDSLWPKRWIVVTRELGPKDWDVCVFYGHRQEPEERILCQTRKLATLWHRHLVRKYREEREEKRKR